MRQSAILHREVVSEGLSRQWRDERVSQVEMWWGCVLGSENRERKGLRVGAHWKWERACKCGKGAVRSKWSWS